MSRAEFGILRCTAGLADRPPCRCELCVLEGRLAATDRRQSGDKTVTAITQVRAQIADTLYNTGPMSDPRETKMTNHEMFNPAAQDGVLVWVGLRMVPVSLVLAAVFAWLS